MRVGVGWAAARAVARADGLVTMPAKIAKTTKKHKPMARCFVIMNLLFLFCDTRTPDHLRLSHQQPQEKRPPDERRDHAHRDLDGRDERPREDVASDEESRAKRAEDGSTTR